MVSIRVQVLSETGSYRFPLFNPPSPLFNQVLSQRNAGPFGMGCLEFRVKVPDFIVMISPNLNKLPHK